MISHRINKYLLPISLLFFNCLALQAKAFIVQGDTINPRQVQGYASQAEQTGAVFSQSFSLSPEAAAAGRAEGVNVSLYTGVPEINVPIFTICVGSYQMPITLRYAASGIKVAQEATRLGLGWDLQAGGIISRNIRDKDDLQFAVVDPDSAALKLATISENEARTFDCEADIFHYNFAGYSGRFFLKRKVGSTQVLECLSDMPEQLLDIRYNNGVFSITTTDNITYVFAAQEIVQQYWAIGKPGGKATQINGITVGADAPTMDSLQTAIPSAFSSDYEATTAWYLTEIILPSDERIGFAYDFLQNSYLSPAMSSWTIIKRLHSTAWSKKNPNPSARVDDMQRLDISLVKQFPVLRNISWPNGTVSFIDANEPRRDIRPYTYAANHQQQAALREIHVANAQGYQVARYVMEHDYFQGADTTGQPSVPSEDEAFLLMRLMLKAVHRVGGADSLSYRFAYQDSDALPQKNSPQTDRWGYFAGFYGSAPCFDIFSAKERTYAIHSNGIDSKGNLCYTYDSARPLLVAGQTVHTDNYLPIPAANAKATTWALTAFTAPTGLTTELIYEPNDTAPNDTALVVNEILASATIETSPLLTQPTLTLSNAEGAHYAKIALTYHCTKEPTLILNEPTLPPLSPSPLETSDTTAVDNYYAEQGRTILTIKSNHTSQTIVGIPDDAAYSLTNAVDTYTFTRIFPITAGQPVEISLSPVAGATLSAHVALCEAHVNTSAMSVGGIRIKEMRSPLSHRRYYYLADNTLSSGTATHEAPCTEYRTGFEGTTLRYVQYVAFHSASAVSQHDIYTGQHIGYSKVRVEEVGAQENHLVDHYYYNIDYPTAGNMQNNAALRRNGQLLRRVVYANGQPVSEQRYTYEAQLSPAPLFQTFSLANQKAYWLTQPFYGLTEKHTFIRGTDTSDTLCISHLTRYAYHPFLCLPTRITQANANGDEHTTAIIYAYDLNPQVNPSAITNHFTALCNNHLYALPIVEKHYAGTMLQQQRHFVYADTQMGALERTVEFNANAGTVFPNDNAVLEPNVAPSVITRYNRQGRAIAKQYPSGREHISLWGYHNQYVVAEIDGTSLQALQQLGIDADDLAEQQRPEESPSWERLKQLSTPLPQALVTLREYIPLIGLVRETLPNGLTLTRHYDAFGRLSSLAEEQGPGERILKAYSYEKVP